MASGPKVRAVPNVPDWAVALPVEVPSMKQVTTWLVWSYVTVYMCHAVASIVETLEFEKGTTTLRLSR